jgi:hypothetical protein
MLDIFWPAKKNTVMRASVSQVLADELISQSLDVFRETPIVRNFQFDDTR